MQEPEQNKIEVKKNFWKCIFLTLSIGLMTLMSSAGSWIMVSINMVYTFILSMVALNVVDIIYYLIQLKRRLKRK